MTTEDCGTKKTDYLKTAMEILIVMIGIMFYWGLDVSAFGKTISIFQRTILILMVLVALIFAMRSIMDSSLQLIKKFKTKHTEV